METKNKITVIVTSMLIVAVSLMSCKTNHSFRAVYQKSDYYDVEVGASYVSFPEEGMRFMTTPGYTFKVPKMLFKGSVSDEAVTLVLLMDNQYLLIVYEPHKFCDCRYDSLDFDGLMYILESRFVYEEYRYYSKVKKIPQRILKAESNNRINHIFRKDGFVIGLFNFLPQNKESMTKLIEETLKFKKYEGQFPVISFLKDLH